MKRTLATVSLSLVLACPALAAAGDTDGDGIPDTLDKCTLDSRNAASGADCDTDSDGYGNVCDPDFDQSLRVNPTDFTRFFVPSLKSHTPADTGTDMDCNGKVDKTDHEQFFVPKFKGALGGAVPGPSGLSCAGQAVCK